jgi:hypothetical protein
MKKLLILGLLLLAVTGYSQSSKFKSIVLKPTEQPGNPTEGELYYDSTQDSVYLYTGSAGWDATRQSIVSDLIDYINTTGVLFKTPNEALNIIETYHPNRWQPEKL